MKYNKIEKNNNFAVMFNGDSMELMNEFISENKKIDLILTSPPYNTTSRKGASDEYNRRYDGYSDNLTKSQYSQWTVDLFNKFNDIINKNGIVLYNMSYSSENTDGIWITIADIINNTDFTVADTIIWKKKTAIPNNRSCNKLTRITEYVFVFCRKNEIKTFNANKKVKSRIERTGQANYENIYNFIEAKNNDKSCKLNKATFSSDLVKQLLEIYAKPNSLIFDPFMGTGTTAVGALQLGINCLGCELSQEQWEFSTNRIEKVK